jgi:hypothetical protein
MKRIDFYFYYKHVLRFLLIQKLGLFQLNVYTIPNISSVQLYFSVKNLIDLEDLKCSNFFFFFQFFFGKRAFFTNFSSRFSLNILYHNFNINLLLKKRECFFCLNFILNELR